MKKILHLAVGIVFIIFSTEIYSMRKSTKQLVPAFLDSVYEQKAKELLQPYDLNPQQITKKKALNNILNHKVKLYSQALEDKKEHLEKARKELSLESFGLFAGQKENLSKINCEFYILLGEIFISRISKELKCYPGSKKMSIISSNTLISFLVNKPMI